MEKPLHRIILDTDVAMGAAGSDIDDGFAMTLAVGLPGQSLELVFLRTTRMLAMPGEFNVWVDPEAAAIVLDSGAPLRFIGLDVTLQVQLGRADADRLQATGRPFAAYAGACAHAWIDYLGDAYPGRGFRSAPLHDPLAVAVVSRPARVAVEACSDITRGVTVADLLAGRNPPPPNCLVATEVDSAAFLDFFLSHVLSL